MRLLAGTPFDRPPRCERCGGIEGECGCPPPPAPPPAPPDRQQLRLAVEKRKKGKVVTVARGFSTTAEDLNQLLTQLKNACGAGGTVKEGTVEVQGDHLERMREILSRIGFRVR